jgi:midasin
MMESFWKLCDAMKSKKMMKELFILNALKNIIQYFKQYSGTIDSYLNSQKAPIHKELKEFAKIASWKDVNVYALKESAKRSHYQLNKILKKYRAVLKGSIADIVTNHKKIPTEVRSLDFDTMIAQFHTRIAPGCLDLATGSMITADVLFPTMDGRFHDFENILKKAKYFAKISIDDRIGTDFSIQASNLAGEIISVVEQYGASGGESSKKGEKSIRRKAWADLLKFLQYMGLNPRGYQLYHQCKDRSYLLSRPSLIDDLTSSTEFKEENIDGVATSAQSYYFRVLAAMENYPEGPNTPVKDITQGEFDKAIGYSLHILDVVIKQRECLSNILPSFVRISGLCNQLSSLLEHATRPVHDYFDDWEVLKFWDTSLSKYLCLLNSCNALVAQSKFFCEQNIVTCINFKNSLAPYVKQFQLCGNNSFTLLPKSLSQDILDWLTGSLGASNNQNVDDFIADILQSYAQIAIPGGEKDFYADIDTLANSLMDKCLIGIQNLKHMMDETHLQSDRNRGIFKSELIIIHEFSCKRLRGAVFDEVATMLTSILDLSQKSTQFNMKLAMLYPLVKVLKNLLFFRICEFLFIHRSMAKLNFVICSVFLAVFANGFCITEENEEESNPDELENAQGTGLGEGEGKKDVSKEIDEQEEVEGLQTDPQEPTDQNIPNEKDAVEMDNDFEGYLDDLSLDGDEDDRDPESLEDVDEQMGDLDSELADAVDEKAWNDESDLGGSAEDKIEKDSMQEAGKRPSETVAQEFEAEVGDKSPGQSDNDDTNSEKNEVQDDAIQDEINQDQNFEDNLGLDPNRDAIDLDDSENENDEEQSGENPSQEERDGDAKAEELEENDQEMQESRNEIDELTPDDPSGENDLPNGDESFEEIDNPKEESGEEEESKDSGDEIAEPEELQQGDSMNDLEDSVDNLPEPEDNVAGIPDDMEVDGEFGNLEETRKSGGLKEGNIQDGMEHENREDVSIDPQTEGGQENTNQKNMPSTSKPKHKSSKAPNPLRSLGNALEEWKSRLKNIQDGDSSMAEELPLGSPDPLQEYEYVNEGDENQGNEQALGIASWDQVEKIEGKAFDQDTEDDRIVSDTELESDGEVENLDALHQKPFEDNKGKKPGPSMDDTVEEPTQVVEKQKNGPEAQMEDDLLVQRSETFRGTGIDAQGDVRVEATVETEIKDYETIRQEMEQQLRERSNSDISAAEALRIWKSYSSLTMDSAFQLCEQLRLILQPTLSTKLKGDYRTGRRLNMRKIIPYIASNFKKDKIWMRRTKPSKRTYQILLSVDDSISMNSPHCVQLAFESLAMITTALNQLEVGEVGIVSFGESIQLLHPFETPWSDDSGASVIQSFSFKQEQTQVKLLMDQAIKIMEHARHTQRGDDLWQLQIIISDGICGDHEYIRSRVLSAAEERIATVFLVLEIGKEKSSILDIKNALYEIDPSTNASKLKMVSYIDTFPFDYYVIVRNVEDLPEVLSETLRQFFMFFSE